MSTYRPPLNSADFNIREISKQMILLEDHLADDEKYCQDCIRKHLLAVEAYAEEAVTLDPYGRWVDECRRLAKIARDIMIKFSDGVNKADLAQEIRVIRKRLVASVYDPRGSLNVNFMNMYS